MKALMMDIMLAMMPYMKPAFMVGLVAAGLGLALRIAYPMLGDAGFYRDGLLWSGRIAGILGIFFLACEPMGAMLGAAPNLKWGNPATFDYWLELAFWQIGLGLLVAAIIIGLGVPRARNA